MFDGPMLPLPDSDMWGLNVETMLTVLNDLGDQYSENHMISFFFSEAELDFFFFDEKNDKHNISHWLVRALN